MLHVIVMERMLFAPKCDFCHGKIAEKDLQEGRSLVVLGKRYCPACMKEAVQKRAFDPSFFPAADPVPEPPPPPKPERRAYRRFEPPPGTELVLQRASGLSRLLGRNLVKEWLDVSLGGLAVVVTEKIAQGDKLEARISYTPFGDVFEVAAVARHIEGSKRHPGFLAVGFEFENPSGGLRTFLKSAEAGFKADSAASAP